MESGSFPQVRNYQNIGWRVWQMVCNIFMEKVRVTPAFPWYLLQTGIQGTLAAVCGENVILTTFRLWSQAKIRSSCCINNQLRSETDSQPLKGSHRWNHISHAYQYKRGEPGNFMQAFPSSSLLGLQDVMNSFFLSSMQLLPLQRTWNKALLCCLNLKQ